MSSNLKEYVKCEFWVKFSQTTNSHVDIYHWKHKFQKTLNSNVKGCNHQIIFHILYIFILRFFFLVCVHGGNAWGVCATILVCEYNKFVVAPCNENFSFFFFFNKSCVFLFFVPFVVVCCTYETVCLPR